jgi:DNA-binding transcriptional ArsR family regulator
MSSGNPKRDLYAQFAAVAKAIGNEHRLELLELVAQGERSVEALAERSGLSVANASQHLQHLRRAGLVTARRQAKFVLYRLADDAVLTMLAAMHKVAQRNIGEVERILRSYFHARDDLEPVSRADLQRRSSRRGGRSTSWRSARCGATSRTPSRSGARPRTPSGDGLPLKARLRRPGGRGPVTKVLFKGGIAPGMPIAGRVEIEHRLLLLSVGERPASKWLN